MKIELTLTDDVVSYYYVSHKNETTDKTTMEQFVIDNLKHEFDGVERAMVGKAAYDSTVGTTVEDAEAAKEAAEAAVTGSTVVKKATAGML
jgi:hypothetical protein